MIEVEIKTETGVNVFVSQWDEGGAWIRLGINGGSLYTALTREEAEKLSGCLQAILAQEVTA
jgi:4-hydroxy-3-methylbut-2-en-1-yl diphosphate synthase IspG/GcpE